MNKEEKAKQIKESKDRIEGVPLTELEELNIIEGKGIEYKMGELVIIIPPLKIKQIRKLHEIQQLYLADLPDVDRLVRIIDSLIDVINVDKDKFEENADADDLRNIIQLMSYSYLHGKKMFEKKTIKLKDALISETAKVS
jgi:hypothetical protein